MTSSQQANKAAGAPPEILLQEARAAAAANEEEPSRSKHTTTDQKAAHQHNDRSHEAFPSLEDVPPPMYNSTDYGQLDIEQNGMQTGAQVAADGRVNIKINQRSRKLTNLLAPVLRSQLDRHSKDEEDEPYIPFGLGGDEELPPPPMNVVIQIVGSRGDVQPFIALGQVLKNKYNHRVRVATHPNFRDFVTDNGLEFFSIGGDPAELMAFMVKNPGLMPGFDSLKSGDVGKRRKGIYEMVMGCWRSCIEAGDGTGVPVSDDLLEGRPSIDSGISLSGDPSQRPFIADAIIANPPSFAHMHVAEKLGIPLHLMFTMPWSPTQAFPHPLANIQSSNTETNMTNFITYALVDMLTWQGLGDMINKFREQTLHLEPVSIMWAPGMASRLRIPWTYCWSPALIPKPRDWGNYIDISGFYFLNLATNYTPAPDLAEFLAAGPPPVYIGFGSIVVDDPNAMTNMIFEAVKKTGQRALVSKGWGGLGADELGIPEGVFMLGNVPHDWLFKHVSCVVHHGGAGTTAAGISAGRPTVVVPFFGDQPFWGAMTARAGAGPMPVPYKTLTADKLAGAILEALKPESLDRAAELSAKIKKEDGCESGAESFHKHLHLSELRCSLYPRNTAVWRVKRTDIRLSVLAATVLGNEGLLDFSDLKLYRPREYETEDGPWEPISGGAAALIGTFGNLTMGIADFPVEILKSLRSASMDVKEKHKDNKTSSSGTSTPVTESRHDSTTDLTPSRLPTSPLTTESADTNSLDRTTTDESTASTENGVLSPAATAPVSGVTRKPSAMSSVLSADGDSRPHRRWSRHGSGSGSPVGEKGTRSPLRSPEEIREDACHITVESAVGGAKAVGKIVEAGLKSPMDFTMSLAKGFHNAPKLYGDDTVRKGDKITGLQSGIKAAGLELGFGFFDGITGLVTQPLVGAKKEGATGFVKGAAKGIGGLILKPAAGIWGVPGYTFKGIYTELQRHFGSSVQNYIIAARTAQGYEEWKASTPQQRTEIVSAWKSTELQMRRKGKKYGKEREEEIQSHILTHTRSNSVELMSGFKNTRHLSWDERKALAVEKEKVRKEKKDRERAEAAVRKNSKMGKVGKVKSRCKYCPFDHDSSYHLRPSQSFPSTVHPPSYGRNDSQTSEQLHDEFEEAIQRSVTATSRGDPQQDALIERALRASVRELQALQANGQQHTGDAAYERAVAASINEVKLTRAESAEHAVPTLSSEHEHENASSPPPTYEEHIDDIALTKALTQSMADYKLAQTQGGHEIPHDSPISPDMDDSDSGLGTEDDEAYKATLEESRRIHTENERRTNANANASVAELKNDDDKHEHEAEMKQAMEESTKRADELKRQQTEEEIVLEYVKKQSLIEEEHRRKLAEQAQ